MEKISINILGLRVFVFFGKLKKYLNSTTLVATRGSGLKKAELVLMEKQGFLTFGKIPTKAGKLPKTDNAIVLTNFGKSVIRSEFQEDYKVDEVVHLTNKMIADSQTQIDEVVHLTNKMIADSQTQIDGLSSNISSLKAHLREIKENLTKINQPQSHSFSEKNLSDVALIQVLKEKSITAPVQMRRGMFIAVEYFYQVIETASQHTNDEINEFLYGLFEDGTLDIQMGSMPVGFRSVITPSKSEMNWASWRG